MRSRLTGSCQLGQCSGWSGSRSVRETGRDVAMAGQAARRGSSGPAELQQESDQVPAVIGGHRGHQSSGISVPSCRIVSMSAFAIWKRFARGRVAEHQVRPASSCPVALPDLAVGGGDGDGGSTLP